ncbi:uncharacterized protein [Asterias amurensis]|uniref:uncharacterized protein n=1 Tax=Asterias amurensis TaxID=7602 RepID=UPI003AB341DA
MNTHSNGVRDLQVPTIYPVIYVASTQHRNACHSWMNTQRCRRPASACPIIHQPSTQKCVPFSNECSSKVFVSETYKCLPSTRCLPILHLSRCLRVTIEVFNIPVVTLT